MAFKQSKNIILRNTLFKIGQKHSSKLLFYSFQKLCHSEFIWALVSV